ncbi:MAG: Holliday junction resolvase RuvX [Clostridia bacterium]|nr:Holliday junction resolvase RuvX [Clostridia bacterium]MBQ1259498.1 Holliday junction resolvase RuvX [Clostridia bacterium]
MRSEIVSGKGRLLGVDFGDRRTGIAVCDNTRFIASARETIVNNGLSDCVRQVVEIAKAENVSGIVIGLPVNMDGSYGERAEKCRYFGSLVESESGICVDFCDERMTTIEASRYLGESGTFGKKRKKVIDALSAQIILQNYIDKLKYQS